MKYDFSTRIRQVNPSATQQIADKAKELSQRGEDVISLGVGEPDFDTPVEVKECAKEALDDGFVHYTSTKGIRELREEIVGKLEEENQIDAGIEDVLVTPGGKFSIFLVCQAFLDENDEAILFDPAWVSYDECVKLAGAEPVWSETNANLKPDLEDFKDKINDSTSLVILNSPCNPTGQVYDESTIKAVTEIARENNCLVMSDEIYEKIIYEKEHYSPGSEYDNVITVNGFSKTFSMTGWRLGYTVAEEEVIDEMKKIQQHSVSCPTSFAQKGAVCAYKNKEIESKLEGMVLKYRKRRDTLLKGLKSLDIECTKPEGGFYAFPYIGTDSFKVSEELLDKCHIGVTPGKAFGDGGKGYIRISYAQSEERIKEAIERIRKTELEYI
ncbi:MAG: Aspartate/tyrosine/aromatic aminotransferase [Candidatus Methanohalarchaeum thermophilum]|uniref:Aminotransferase n=1 Tax=Methanohalarchaeum thermophilum TaxID=1903181 RepID=A0A1Q6DVG3_METT1|nr:MAG: Aspartate/tyrosine/aromatic aminotransferase [Candidatus Methanohalarchaeum thermophilum]